MRLVDADKIYEKVQESEELARKRVQDTESYMPYPNNLNPSYTRYLAQMDERTMFKHMIADAPTIEERKWIPCSERMPEAGSWAIWCSNKGIIQVARWKTDLRDHFFPDQGFFELEDAVAWMELPVPYMEVEHDR